MGFLETRLGSTLERHNERYTKEVQLFNYLMCLSSVRLLSRGTTVPAAGGWALSWPRALPPGRAGRVPVPMPATVLYTVALAPRESRATLGQHPSPSRPATEAGMTLRHCPPPWPQFQVEAILAGSESTRSDWPLCVCVCGRGRRSRVVILPRCCQYATLAGRPRRPGPKQTPGTLGPSLHEATTRCFAGYVRVHLSRRLFSVCRGWTHSAIHCKQCAVDQAATSTSQHFRCTIMH